MVAAMALLAPGTRAPANSTEATTNALVTPTKVDLLSANFLFIVRRSSCQSPSSLGWMTSKAGFPFWLPGHHQLYIRPPPSDLFFSFFHPERLQRPRNGQ